MDTATPNTTQLQQAEAEMYATLLDWGIRIGLLIMVLSFAAYTLGIITPLVPLDQLPSLWNKPVALYLQKSGTPTGWGWLAMAGKGDLLNLVGIAILSGCSLPPLLGLITLYLKRRDFAFAAICVAIALVLILAASGVLTPGH